MLLRDKRAVVFGGGGSIGAAVAKELAAEGAEVFVSGRTAGSVDLVAKEITRNGGRAHAHVVDALDEVAVDHYLASVIGQAGSIDIEFNATGPRVSTYGNGKPVVGLPVEEFMTALQTVVRSHFITARAAARHMITQGSGVIIFVTGSPARPHGPGTSAIGAAFGAIENLTRTMAIELGATGVRVVCLRTAANPDSRTIQDVVDAITQMTGVTPEQAGAGVAEGRLLNASPHTPDTAKAVAFLASAAAAMMTGTVLNASAGVCPD
jgi:NAD(P)-dependent dehydrogenase (short-subunit alcohol dehydrogenase family)